MSEQAITWVESKAVKANLYGIVGIIRAFTIDRSGSKPKLQPHLPSKYGHRPAEVCRSVEEAQARALELLREFAEEMTARAPTK